MDEQSDRVPEIVTEQRKSPWLTANEAAAYVGLSRRSIYTACAIGHLRHIRVNGKRELRTRLEWLDQWLERHAYGGDDAADAAPAQDVLIPVVARRR